MAHIIFEGAPEIPAEGPVNRFGRAFERINAPPAAFGALTGEALSAVGQDLTKTANLYGEVAAQQAANNYMDQSQTLITDYLSKRGQDAMEAFDDVQRQLTQLHDQGAAGLGLVASQATYNNQTRYLAARQMGEIGRHRDQQQRIWATSVNLGTMAANDRAIASAYNDDQRFRELAESNRSAAVKNAYLDGTDANAAIGMADNRSVQAALDGALAQNNPGVATQIYQRYGNRLDPRAQEVYGARIKSHGDAALGDQIYNRASAGITSGGLSAGGAVGARGAEAAGPIDFPQAKRLALSAGFRGEKADEMAAISLAESGGNPDAIGDRDIGGSFGLTQINLRAHGPVAKEALGNPQRAMDLAYDISKGGADFTPWTAFKNGAYRSYLPGAGANAASAVPEAARLDSGQTETAPAAAPKFDLAGGDSIAVQQIRHGVPGSEAPFKSEGLGPEGTSARIGDTPQMVLDRLGRLTGNQPDYYRGKTVFWSTGASNDPNQVALAADQIEALKKAGASAIVIPGVGPGVKDAAQVNAELSHIAKAEGAVFFQPDVKWQKDGVHPAEVDKVREQGLAALAAAQPAGQPTVQPIPTAPTAPATPAALTTPIAQPPGMADLAEAQLQAVQHYERTVAAIEVDPQGADNPAAVQRARQRAEQELRSRSLDISARRQVLTEQHTAALDSYMQRMAPGAAIDPNMASEIAADPLLGPKERQDLYGVLQTRTKGTAEQEVATYGPGYFDVLRRMLLPAGDHDRISDLSQLIALGAPDKNGKVWLTASGIRALIPQLAALQKNPNRVSDLRRLQQFFDGVKQKIVREWPGAPADPDQLQRFADFQLMAEKKWDQYVAEKKDPQSLITRGKPDYLGSDDMLKDFVKQDNVLGTKPGAIDLTTQAGIAAAYHGGKINYDQAVEALQKGKFIAGPPPAGPSAPLAQP